MSMIDCAHTALKQLLILAQSNPQRTRDARLLMKKLTCYPSGDAAKDNAFRTSMKLAEEKGVVELTWDKFYHGHDLLKVVTRDPAGLAAYLKEPYYPDLAEEKLAPIREQFTDSWHVGIIGKVEAAWIQGKRAYNISVDESDKLIDVFKSVDAIKAHNTDATLDWRQFGARVLGDSKRLHSISGPLARVLSELYGIKGLENDDVLRLFSIEKMAHPVLVSGPVRFSKESASLSADIPPYIGVPSELLPSFQVHQTPAYVLTIENLSSYLEYTRKIHDGGVVLLTGGYPTGAFQAFYQQLVAQLDGVPLYHWGDVDPDGLQILLILDRLTDERTVKPHLMMPADDGVLLGKAQMQKLKAIETDHPEVSAVIAALIDTGYGFYEQECLEARSPGNDLEYPKRRLDRSHFP